MTEKSALYSDSQILLIGTPISTSEIALGPAWTGGEKLALIYMFYYQNETLALTKPAIFTVVGDGEPVGGVAAPETENAEKPAVAGGTRALPINLRLHNDLGVEARFWIVHRHTEMLRLDTATGEAAQVLLEREFGSIEPAAMQSRGAEPMMARRRWRALDED